MNNAENAMAVCGWSIPPAFATVVRVRKRRAVPMERQRNAQTAPGQLVAPSPGGGISSTAATRDWSRRHQRRACLRLHRQRLEIQMESPLSQTIASSSPMISRAERAHYRSSWDERLARNARDATTERITLTLFGIPTRLATFLGLATAKLPQLAGIILLPRTSLLRRAASPVCFS